MNPFDVPSPCINICKIDEAKQLCIGCARTVDEITRWSGMNNDEKQTVMDAAIERRVAAKQADKDGVAQTKKQG